MATRVVVICREINDALSCLSEAEIPNLCQSPNSFENLMRAINSFSRRNRRYSILCLGTCHLRHLQDTLKPDLAPSYGHCLGYQARHTYCVHASFFFFSFYGHTCSIWKFLASDRIQATAAATATLDPSSLWQHQILNPLSEAGDRTHIFTDTMLGS